MNKKNIDKINLKDQYLKAYELFDLESTRFWTRFNLFTGLQLIVIAGISSNFQELLKYVNILALFIFIAFSFSIFTIFIMCRSRQISMGIFKTILELENYDDSFILMKIYIKKSKSPMGVIAKYCIIMSSLLAIFWLIFFYNSRLG
jgi:hypothetical protein